MPGMSSRGQDQLRRTDARSWLCRCALIGLFIVPVLVSGCAIPRLSNPFGSDDDEGSASAGSESRLLDTARAEAGTELPSGSSLHCPQVVAWPRDRLLTIYQAGHVGDSNAVVHRGEITKMARDCQLLPDRVIVKYGFAGRVLLGPKGGPGSVSLAVHVRVAGAQQNTLATDKMTVTTTIPAGGPAGYFSIVREIAFPIVVGTRPEDYKIFVGFERNVPNAG